MTPEELDQAGVEAAGSEQLFDWLQAHYANVGVTPELRAAYKAYLTATKPPIPNEAGAVVERWRDICREWAKGNALIPGCAPEEYALWQAADLITTLSAQVAHHQKFVREFNDAAVDATARATAAESSLAACRAALAAIVSWSEAYPLKVFPEPDFDKVRALLEAGGVTLDAVSASNMRHVVTEVGAMARAALHPGAGNGE